MSKHGTCNWCNSLLVAPDDYDNRQHRLYCSKECYWMDWMFKQWQNDQYLEWFTKHYTEGNNGPT